MRHRRPLGLLYLPGDSGEPLARLTGLEGLTRAVMIGSVPLAALEALGSTAAVSVAFAAGSAITLLVTLNIARLERHLARRWILSGGIAAVFAAAAIFAYGPGWAFPIAITLRSAHASIFSVCLSLYIMDYVGKQDMTIVESRRAVYLAAAWVAGPTVGTWLWSRVDHAAPFVVSMALAALLMAYHWWLRLERRNPVLLAPIHPAPSPLSAISRFFRQRYLRASYVITSVRSVYWSAVVIYGPIYVVEAGLPAWVAGVFLSLTSAVLFIGPLVQRVSVRHGIRTLIVASFVLAAGSLVVLTLLGDPDPIGLVFWFTGAVGAGVLDVIANIPFMRLVRPRERAAMTTVFTTWRETSFFITPALAALVLLVGPLWLLYPVLAALMLVGAGAALSLPRRL